MGVPVTRGRSVVLMLVALAALVGFRGEADGASTNLVAAYSFDAGSGSTLADVSGNGNNGTISGATWTTGRTGGALSFDGTDDLVTVADSASLDLTSGMTLEAWVKPTAAGGVWRTVAFKEKPGGMTYALYAADEANRPTGQVSVGGERNARGNALALGTWSHVATTYDGSTLRLYVNGALLGSQAVAGAAETSTGPLRLGGNTVWSEWFAGQLDDLRIYSRALTAVEISADMRTPLGGGTAPAPPPAPAPAPAPSSDRQAPTAPTGLSVSARATTGFTLSWNASTDNVGVTGYGAYRGSARVGSSNSATRTYAFTGLVCGTNYAVGVDAVDAAGNRSARTLTTAATAACSAPPTPPSPPPTPTPPPVTGSLVAAYAFDAGSGATLLDSSGRGNHGTISGPSWTTAGHSGNALTFDGVDDLVTVADAASLDATSAVTLEAWVRPTGGGSWRTVVTKEQSGNLVYGLFSDSDSAQPATIVSMTGSAQQDIARGPSALPMSSWTHVATTYDGSMLKLYVNGSQVGSKSVTGGLPNSSGPLQIGGNRVWPEWFQGQVDDVRVYTRALTATEVQADMATPVAPPPPPAPADTQAPTTPSGLSVSGQTQTSLTLSWVGSTDNVGVAGYAVYSGTTKWGDLGASDRSVTFSGLACGASYTLGVDAVDAAGNRSVRATATGTTASCSAPTPPPPTGSGTAHLWVDASGGSCVDSASPVAYNDAQACSWQQANATCEGGDTVLVKGGNYGNLSIRGSNGRTSACTFRTASGETVTAGSFNLGEWQSCVRGAASTSTTNWFSLVGPIKTREFHADCSNQVTVDGLDMDAGGVQITQPFQVQAGATNFTLRNSKVHNALNSNAMMVLQGSNFVLDNNDIYDGLNNTNGAIHDECVRAQPVNGMTMTRNHIWSCAVMDVFLTGSEYATDWLVENNVFEPPLGSSGNSTNAFAFRCGGSPSPSPDNFVMRYNTFGSTGVQLCAGDSPPTTRGFTVVGNYFATNTPCGLPNTTYGYNVTPTGVSNCGGPGAASYAASTLDAGFVRVQPFTGNNGGSRQPAGDYRLVAGSPLADRGHPSAYPALDRLGVTRFVGPAADVGAFERP